MSDRSTLTEQVLDQLRTAVLNGELKPGQRYTASGLAEQYGVSRTPVREALLELERSGMARIEKNRGVTVVANSLEEIVNCYQLRLLLEAPAAARAAQVADDQAIGQIEARFAQMRRAAAEDDVETLLRADRDFHSELLAVAQNPRLVTVLEGLRDLVLTTGIATVPHSRSCHELVEDHRDILEAVQDRSPERAAAAMRRHVHNTATLIIRREAAQGLQCENPGDAPGPPNAAEFEAKLFSFEFGDARQAVSGDASDPTTVNPPGFP